MLRPELDELGLRVAAPRLDERAARVEAAPGRW